MKKNSSTFFFISFCLLLGWGQSFAQDPNSGQTNYNQSSKESRGISITPMYGYVFNETFYTYDYEVELEDATPYGLAIGFEVREDFEVELSYFHQKTTASINSYYFLSDEAETSLDYIFVGFNHNVMLANPAITPFAGLDLGAAIASPEGYSTEARFTFGLKAGLKAMFSDHIGLRVQTQLWVPVQGAGIFVAAGTGGASTGVSVSSSITQFGFEGGLIFKL